MQKSSTFHFKFLGTPTSTSLSLTIEWGAIKTQIMMFAYVQYRPIMIVPMDLEELHFYVVSHSMPPLSDGRLSDNSWTAIQLDSSFATKRARILEHVR